MKPSHFKSATEDAGEELFKAFFIRKFKARVSCWSLGICIL